MKLPFDSYPSIFGFTCFVLSTVGAYKKALSTPQITHHPESEIAYRPLEDVTVTCVANVESNSTYFWKKNGEPLNVTSEKILMRQGVGSIVIKAPTASDEGVYQCYARNDFGTAISLKSILRRAVLETFPTVASPVLHRPPVGAALNLTCQPPRRYPDGKIYWAVTASRSNNPFAIENDDRILLDYDGGLYFANVLESDFQNGGHYVCVVGNEVLGKYVQGNDQKVQPDPIGGSLGYHEPRVMWTSPLRDIAIVGQPKKMKCIFSGLPTPRITWRRLDTGDQTPSNKLSVTKEGFGSEIEIESVNFEDAGRYECSATNREGGEPVRQEIVLVVESPPHWRNNRKPPSTIDVPEEDNVIVPCLVGGSPKPTVSWFVNGVPLSDLTPEPRRQVMSKNNSLRFENVSTGDSQMLQCMASNEHGDIIANIAFNVLAASPTFTSTPRDLKVVVGKNAIFNCRVLGAPKPKIVWKKGYSREQVTGSRFVVHNNGDLEIKDAQTDDEGSYHCFAYNKRGSEEAAAQLLVKQPTVISGSPSSQTVKAGDDFRLECDVRTDPSEVSRLSVEWRRDGRPIDARRDRHVSVDPTDNSLSVNGSEVKDTGVYTCHADNGLDQADSHQANVTVIGPPDAPTEVRVTACTVDYAVVTWRPSSDNNDQVTEYLVFYNQSYDDPTKFTEGAKLSTARLPTQTTHLSVTMPVRPWTTYSFYVVARNGIGDSAPSELSQNVCSTPQVAPYKNPRGVCTRLAGSRQLVIVWQPLPRAEHHGEGFHYRVGYKLVGSREPTEVKVVRNAKQSELIVHNHPVFKQYEIFVQSANDKGVANLTMWDKKIGYSGEGKPTVFPENLRIIPSTLNGSYVQFLWDPVSTKPEQIKGFFKGYRIEFWRADHPEDKRAEDIIIEGSFDLCPPLVNHGELDMPPSRKRSVRSLEPVHGSTNQLWPFSQIRAGVLVLNQGHHGQLSDPISFDTPEGEPGPLQSLEVTESSSSHLRVEWKPPVDPNGIIRNYLIEYQVAPPQIGEVRTLYIDNPMKNSAKIVDLEPSTEYVISMFAATYVGRGLEIRTNGKTLPVGALSNPEIGRIQVSDNSANVSWYPVDRNSPTANPGSRFYVEYRDRRHPDPKAWNQTDVVTDENWANVTKLEPSETYDFRVVAVSGLDKAEQSRSDVWTVFIGPKQDSLLQAEAASAGWWFIILMCIIILLLVVLFIICIVTRGRGEIYPVYEKEKLWGHPHENDEKPFGEYLRANLPVRSCDIRRSKESLESDQKPLDTTSSDSMDYDDSDPNKFNEDGSFIGIYNSKTNTSNSTTNVKALNAANTYV